MKPLPLAIALILLCALANTGWEPPKEQIPLYLYPVQ